MRIQQVVILLTAIMMSSCCSGRVLTMKDYKKMPEDEMRNLFLQHTPIGCSKETVEKFLKKKICKSFETKEGTLAIGRINYNPKKENGDFYFKVYLANYGVLQRFFLGGYIVKGFWLFNKHGILKDVQV